MSVDVLGFWSAVALVIRVGAIAMLLLVAYIQLQQFRFKTSLQPLKRLLLGAVTVIVFSNLPIVYLHWVRIARLPSSESVTALATVTNAVSMFIVAVLLLLVYRFRSDEPPQ